ncbi:hypothetical protein F4782DRAFT_493309 [Xylaria castorea]|nr:hypothetical protein F4782DRAFT_493309 [Xylaria castorea]
MPVSISIANTLSLAVPLSIFMRFPPGEANRYTDMQVPQPVDPLGDDLESRPSCSVSRFYVCWPFACPCFSVISPTSRRYGIGRVKPQARGPLTCHYRAALAFESYNICGLVALVQYIDLEP